jgi:hypothetical protein
MVTVFPIKERGLEGRVDADCSKESLCKLVGRPEGHRRSAHESARPENMPVSQELFEVPAAPVQCGFRRQHPIDIIAEIVVWVLKQHVARRIGPIDWMSHRKDEMYVRVPGMYASRCVWVREIRR